MRSSSSRARRATRGTPGRRLRVDDDASCEPGSLHDEVRPETAVLGRDVRLRLEVAVLEHPGHLDDSPQLDLAPARRALRPVAQGADEVPGLAAELALRLGELAHLRRSAPSTRACARPRAPAACRRPSGATRPDRRHEVLDRLLALFELLRRRCCSCSSLPDGEVEERLVVPLQRVGCERAETSRGARPPECGLRLAMGPARADRSDDESR